MSLAYISISKNKRKTKINGDEKLTTTYAFTILYLLPKRSPYLSTGVCFFRSFCRFFWGEEDECFPLPELQDKSKKYNCT